jgi:hypothetical protein
MVRRIRDEYGDHVKFLTTPTLPLATHNRTAPVLLLPNTAIALHIALHVELVGGSFTSFDTKEMSPPTHST